MVSQREMVIEMHTDIKHIKQELIGNGKPGLIKRVMDIESIKNKVLGGFIVVSGIATSSLVLVLINYIWG